MERPHAGLEDCAAVFTKAAALLQSLISNHPFIDGNKRTGMSAAGIFLELNGWRLVALPDKLEDYAVRIATETLSVDDIATWLESHAIAWEE